jgi:pimeloyl-ACP methyl ester carboxylesterase
MRVETFEISHVSTLPVNQGRRVHLSLTEYDPGVPADWGRNPVVLMLGGRSIPAASVFAFGDLAGPWAKYNWAAQLARSNIHCFIMDLQGYGRSTHPDVMGDVYNVAAGDRDKAIRVHFPDGLQYPYPHHLTDTNSALAEVYEVMDWIRAYRGPLQKIHLVGYSAGAFIVGRLAMENPLSVASLFLLAPVFPPYGLSNELANPPASFFGFPMRLQSYQETMDQWNSDGGAMRQSGIEAAVWKSIWMEDPFPQRWGDVIRYPNWLRWGWNPNKVESNPNLGNTVPVAIVYGYSDTQAFTRPEVTPSSPRQPEHPGTPFNCRWLFHSIPGPDKLMISLYNTGHFMQWETKYDVLHSYSAQWFKSRSIGDESSGTFIRDDSTGLLTPTSWP